MMSEFSFSDTDQALWLSHFDIKGVFIGTGLAIIPKNTGLPANTTVMKCEPPAGFTGVWNGNGWDYIIDMRGKRYWSKFGVGHVIIDVNEIIPEDAVLVEPPKFENGFVLLFEEGEWLKIRDRTGEFYFDDSGKTLVVPEPYFKLPEHCTYTPPPEKKKGYSTQWNGYEWLYIEDNRGLTVYSKIDGSPSVIDYIGPIDYGFTQCTPSSRFDVWEDGEWVTDEDAKLKQIISDASTKRYLLRNEADSEISVLRSAVKFGVASESEKNQLEKWELYQIELMRINVNDATNINWPVKP